jgi:hypothetical protein
MQRNRRTSIIVVGGALAIASIGYGLGTQADDGTAVAGSDSDRSAARGLAFEHGPPPGFSNLAETLGVETGQLEDALGDFHEQEHAERRDELATALAKALDVPVDRVKAALEQTHDRLERRFEARGERGDDGPRGRVMVRHALPLRQLAAALDVTPAELRKAFEEIRPDRPKIETKWKQHQQELAEFLAERFDLDVEKVTDALADLPRPAPPPHDGRPGPGGPGAFGPAH